MNEEILKAVEVLMAGGVILYPTDTIWGIGCDATNTEAVKKVYAIKKRHEAKSLIVLVDSDIRLERTIEEVPEVAWDLIEYSEKPVTIIYDKPIGIAANAVHKDKSLGIRIVKDKFCKELIRRLNKPIVSTSANISGEEQATNFSEINDEIKKAVDHIVNFRHDELNLNQSSMVIKLDASGLINIIRK
tara:strand:- start:10 stop:573 length:564 start_codon:yes stop_codon:yes gene_type:complete